MLSTLQTLIDERNTKDQATQLKKFADIYYSGAPVDEVLARAVDDLYGAALSCWQLIQERELGVPKVRVFNPDHENHGWQSLHTVIEIVFEDMPFLVDSIRMQLNSRQMSLHAIHYCAIHATRDKDNKLNVTSDWVKPGKSKTTEAIIYIEVDHHSDKQLMAELSAELEEVLLEVQRCVRDFPSMLQKAKDAALEIKKDCGSNDSVECEEASAFMNWVASNHALLAKKDRIQ